MTMSMPPAFTGTMANFLVGAKTWHNLKSNGNQRDTLDEELIHRSAYMNTVTGILELLHNQVMKAT